MKYCVLILLFLSFMPLRAEAGKLYAREKGKYSPIYNLVQTRMQTSVRIDDRLATTHVDERFLNNTAVELEGFYVFELPEGAHVDGLWMWVDGKRQTFVVRRREDAEQVYDSLKDAGIGDPAILSTLGANRFQLRVFPLPPGQERRIELEYFQLLPVGRDGRIRFAYPMNMSGYQSAPVETLSLTVALRAQAPIADITTNFDNQPTMLTRTAYGSTHHELTLGVEDIVVEEDFVLSWTVEGWTDSLFVLTHTAPHAPDSSVFLAWFPDTVASTSGLATDIVFAIDASGSMTGLRAELVRTLVSRMLSYLSGRDRVHLLLFNDGVQHFPADTTLTFVSPALPDHCAAFLEAGFRPRGVTDFGQAFDAIAALSYRTEAQLRCILITDGLVNRGDRETSELLGHVRPGQRHMLIFPVVVYSDRVEVLYDLARSSGGKLCALEQGMDMNAALGRFTFSFDAHTVSDLSILFPQGTAEVLPSFSAAATLQEAMGTGRFTPPVIGDAILRYRVEGVEELQEVRRAVALHADTASPVQIARHWAALRIAQLCGQLVDVKDSTAIREEVIALSEKYNVLSPFTAFIVYHVVDGGGGATATGVLALPEQLHLAQNYPNPFNPTTTITFTVPAGAHEHAPVRIHIFDALGRLIRTLVDQRYAPGTYHLTWDATDTDGQLLPSGNYFCVLTLGDEQRSITMSFVK
jgi:Ca-activated chloride channel family protein